MQRNLNSRSEGCLYMGMIEFLDINGILNTIKIGLLTMCLQVFGRFSDDFSVLNKICEKILRKTFDDRCILKSLRKTSKICIY